MTPRPLLRWTVPAGVTALVLGGAVVGPALTASAEVELPERTVEQLLTDLQTADVDAFSGTVAHRADLGLPALPEAMGGDHHSTDVASLLDGEHTLRVWAAGHSARVSLHGELGELAVVTDGTQVWTWSSDEQTATHLVVPDHATADRDAALSHAVPPVTPEQVTDRVLGMLEASAEVTSGPHVAVAGRPAYQLVVQPADTRSLIGSVRIAVDAEEHVPTRVQVYPAGADAPAVEVGFTQLSFEAPDDDVFTFSPPPGAITREHTLDGHDGTPLHDGAHLDNGPTDATQEESPTGARHGAVVGTGWTTVVVSRVPGPAEAAGEDLRAFVTSLPQVGGEWGSGRLLTSTLFSALLTDDGRLLVGAVDGDLLQQAAADPAADLG